MSDHQEWRRHAKCKGAPPAVFFPTEGDPALASTAKAVCAKCKVRAECLEYALGNREEYGIWGGATTTERRKMLARRARGGGR
jgi:WhiB family redox-sensing transcriptional regulator